MSIPDDVIDCCQDREDNKYTIFITKKKGVEGNGQYGVHCLYENKLYDITDQFKKESNSDDEEGFLSRPNIFFLFSINDEAEFIL
jgi:hypothetical protein